MWTSAKLLSRRSATTFVWPEDFLRDLTAGRERRVRQCLLGTAARQAELEFVVRRREHDERALGVRELDGGVEHERQDLVQHATRSEGPEALEQGIDLPQVVAGAGRRPARRQVAFVVGRQEGQVGAAAASQPDTVAGLQLALLDRVTVDERPVAGVLVAQQVSAVLAHDFRVLAGDLAAAQPEAVGFATPNREGRPVDGDDPFAEHVADFEARFGHDAGVSL
jgi:hypothetical protein